MGNLTLALLALGTIAALAIGLRAGGSTLGGPVALAAAFLATQLGLRPLTLALGLDEPYLQNPAYMGSPDSLAVRAGVVGLVWVVLLITPLVVLRGLGSVQPSAPRRSSAGQRDHSRAVAVLLAIGLAGTAWYMWRLGGPVALTDARKGKGPATSSLPRNCLLAAAVLGAASLSVIGAAAARRRPWLAITTVTAVLAGLAWGARDIVVFPLVAAVGVRLADVSATASWARLRRWAKPLLAGTVLVLGLLVGARAARDHAIDREPGPAAVDAGPARQLMVSSNLTSFDALMVVVSQWPDLADPPGFEEFRRQLPGPLGGHPLPGEPASFNVRVAQISVPGRLNGTPPTAAGDWWAAGGWVALAAGAVLSGCLLAAAERWHARRRDDRAGATAWATIIVLGTASTGVTTSSTARLATLLFPVCVVVAVSWLQRPSTHPVTAAEQQPATPSRR